MLLTAPTCIGEPLCDLVSHSVAEVSALVLSLAKCFKAVVLGLDQVGLLERQTSFLDARFPSDSGN